MSTMIPSAGMSARPESALAPSFPFRPVPRAMTRCECTGVTFAEIARQVEAEGLTLEEAQARTGCGGLCTACVPDLRDFLRSRR
ncbi:(2Fe-2S)-binding protein [Acidobacteria bacterium ACD]|nr:MAG: (2Fe-2S)-binding protein [Acidobacteriota bacterium]MCE7957383.1 (2Fe-2S)-binding protein [Acidobacteria bacterium ACB2]MDL1951203.1 (2Fe-2S)-binding protein [Acidobacteria bacterium ACD]